MPNRSGSILDVVAILLFALGILLAIVGLGLDYLPGTSPGLHFPQLLLILVGLSTSLGAYVLRNKRFRRRLWRIMKTNYVAGIGVTAITLVVLEMILIAIGISTYFPLQIPKRISLRVCDEMGCHYEYDSLIAACGENDISGRHCILNSQGYHDRQEFVVQDDFPARDRVLMLGDSFTFGFTADIGKSYVETIEAHFPRKIVWNSALAGNGTNQALASFQALAPMLRPQLTILGFTTNDFDDNLMSTEFYMASDSTESKLGTWQDQWGNMIELDYSTARYYRSRDIDPPASEAERLIGMTRIGTLMLRFIDLAGESLVGDRRFDRKVAVTREYLRILRDAAAMQDTALLTLLIPERGDIAQIDEFYAASIQLMEELGIPYVNPVNALDASIDYAPKPDGHWSTAGHQKIASLLIPCLESFFDGGLLSDCTEVSGA